jgi:hypothetical protein
MIVTIQSKYLNLSEVKHSFNNDFPLGLVDAEDEADFKIKLTSLKAKWDSKERCYLSRKDGENHGESMPYIPCTHVKTHKLLQVYKQVVTNMFTSCRQVVFALLVPSCCNKFGISH